MEDFNLTELRILQSTVFTSSISLSVIDQETFDSIMSLKSKLTAKIALLTPVVEPDATIQPQTAEVPVQPVSVEEAQVSEAQP